MGIFGYELGVKMKILFSLLNLFINFKKEKKILFEKKECNLNILNYFSMFEKMSLKGNR